MTWLADGVGVMVIVSACVKWSVVECSSIVLCVGVGVGWCICVVGACVTVL